MESANSQDIMGVLRNDETGPNQRDNSRRKSSSANICRAGRDHSQMPLQISGERQHQQSCQRQAASSHPIMTGIITRRKQVGDDAVSPVVIFGEYPRAHSQRSEKRKENQRQQDKLISDKASREETRMEQKASQFIG